MRWSRNDGRRRGHRRRLEALSARVASPHTSVLTDFNLSPKPLASDEQHGSFPASPHASVIAGDLCTRMHLSRTYEKTGSRPVLSKILN